MVQRILRKYRYPPDKQKKATQTVLEQAELLSSVWAVDGDDLRPPAKCRSCAPPYSPACCNAHICA